MTHERGAGAARSRIRRLLIDLGTELRDARLGQGRTLEQVASATGISRSQLSRVELAEAPRVSLDTFVRLGEALGLELSARYYPGRRRLRDGPQLGVLRGLAIRLGPDWIWRYEVPVAHGDQRAWDARAVHRRIGQVLHVDAETRIRDIQAVLRRTALKRDSSPAARTILLVAGTRRNRMAIREAGDIIRTAFPVGTQVALAMLAQGRDPGVTA